MSGFDEASQAFSHVFSRVSTAFWSFRALFEASFVEIYSPDGVRENLIDLLAAKSDDAKLELKQDVVTQGPLRVTKEHWKSYRKQTWKNAGK